MSTLKMSGSSLSSSSGSAPEARWTLAFAIVMLLLFALFLVLYATSKKEVLKLRDEISTLRLDRTKPRAEKVPESSGERPDEKKSAALAANAELQALILSEAKNFLATDAAGANAKGRSDVEVLDLANGDFMVRVSAPNLFPVGKSHISKEIGPFVDRLGELILKSGRRLRIEGHADFNDAEAIQRKSSEFVNTWELSAARSAGLAQYWMRKFNLDPEKIEAAAFGKYRPLENGVGRTAQANRRIEIVIFRAES